MFDNEAMAHREPVNLNDLQVRASGTYYKVQLVAQHGMLDTRHVDVHASVDPVTGEVRFYVNPQELGNLQ